RGVHLPVQERINREAIVTPENYLPTYLSAPTASQLTRSGEASAFLSKSSFEPVTASLGRFLCNHVKHVFHTPIRRSCEVIRLGERRTRPCPRRKATEVFAVTLCGPRARPESSPACWLSTRIAV